MLRSLKMALVFLTIVPVRIEGQLNDSDLGRSALFFAPIGLAIGALTAVVLVGLGALFPPSVAALLGLALWASLSGCLHLDGWADCCDALPGARSAARRLEILRDPRLGTFGGAGLALLLLAKHACLADLLVSGHAPAALLLAPTLGRAAMVAQAWLFPLARTEGLAFHLRQGLRPDALVATVLTAGLVSLVLGPRAWLALGFAVPLAMGFGCLAWRRLGGLSGDVYGATCEMVELSVVLVFTARL